MTSSLVSRRAYQECQRCSTNSRTTLFCSLWCPLLGIWNRRKARKSWRAFWLHRTPALPPFMTSFSSSNNYLSSLPPFLTEYLIQTPFFINIPKGPASATKTQGANSLLVVPVRLRGEAPEHKRKFNTFTEKREYFLQYNAISNSSSFHFMLIYERIKA